MKQEIIRLGSLCNQKCLFCNQEENIPKKDKKQILYELLKLRKKGINRIIISGGEPTLFKEELFFTISIAKKLGFKEIDLQSNAVLLENTDYVSKLKKLGLDSVFISLHSFLEKDSDFITQSKGTFNKTIKGIFNLINEELEVSINIVINKYNYLYILDYVKYLKNNLKGFFFISFSVVMPATLALKNRLLPKYSIISKYLINAYDYCIKNNIDFDNPGCGIPICYIKGYEKFSIEYNRYKNNEYLEEGFIKNSKNKIKSEKCKKCKYDKYCLGLWKGYVELYGFNDLVPIMK